jgi:hypothetical protein
MAAKSRAAEAPLESDAACAEPVHLFVGQVPHNKF